MKFSVSVPAVYFGRDFVESLHEIQEIGVEAFEFWGWWDVDLGSPRVKVLFDIYHQQIMEGDLIRRITANINQIGHFHAAGSPGRHELFEGEINYAAVFGMQ